MKYVLIICVVIGFTSCKNESGNAAEQSSATAADSLARTAKQKDGLTLLKGDFVLFDDAAVLQTHREFYGVIINDKAYELNDLVAQYKKAETDMVPVSIRGRISKEAHETIQWPNKVEIVEILNVFEPDSTNADVIKLEFE